MYKGLTTPQAQELLKVNGRNEIEEKHVTIFHKIIRNLTSPISLMLLLASILSFLIHKTFDGYFILVLLLINVVIVLWQENKADNAIKKLNEHLDQKIKVMRDEHWQYINSKLLVAGDVVQLSSGEVVPADGKIVESHHVQIDESALTGESLPKEKDVGDFVYSGSFIKAGIVVVKITATGAHTSYGKTLFSVERVIKRSLLEKDIISISKFLTILSLCAVVILSAVFIARGTSLLELLTIDLSLIIAGIPISLPTVMTLIIEFGVLALATKNAIVRRLSALEDLSNVNFLLTDKTGTLTKNKIAVQDIYSYGTFTHNDVLVYAAILAQSESDNAIDFAILEKVKELRIKTPAFTKVDFIPADSDRKRSTIIIKKPDNTSHTIVLGAAQVIERLCTISEKSRAKFNREVETLAQNGYRTLAVAISDTQKEEEMQLVGLVALSDTLRPDAKGVIEFLKENGIDVSMVTGDNRAIAYNIAAQLGLDGASVVTKKDLEGLKWDAINAKFYKNTGAFAEILPDDKLQLVQKAKEFFVVAANGDGINDLPAIKAANVGIAVKNAVTALKSTADIVLLSEGISVIRDAIIESRKIFERLYAYSLYRISESLRLIVTICLLGLAYGVYPLSALQIIIIALLNDIPIISLAFDRVKTAKRPARINTRNRFVLSSLYGMVGVANSIFLFLLVSNVWHLDWGVVQTMYFLKLTVSGHMLIYVAHTRNRWWRFLPSREVIWATSITQAVATLLALTGFLMPGKISFSQALFVWGWAFFWMQVSEFVKVVRFRHEVS